jgi:transposase
MEEQKAQSYGIRMTIAPLMLSLLKKRQKREAGHGSLANQKIHRSTVKANAFMTKEMYSKEIFSKATEKKENFMNCKRMARVRCSISYKTLMKIVIMMLTLKMKSKRRYFWKKE